MVGDGTCDKACRFADACSHDGSDGWYDPGDCKNKCAGRCGSWAVGNGFCHPECYNEACSWDGGD